MNACDDGNEPVGEAPELTMPRTVSLIDRQADALTVIRELHFEEPSKLLTQPSYCNECYLDWPCRTIRAIRERDLC